MAQWINFLWNNGFVNPTLLCEKTGALAIVEPNKVQSTITISLSKSGIATM